MNNLLLYAIYFALHFALIFLGVLIAVHTNMTWLGLGLSFVIAIKFFLMLPDLNERTDI
jgi:ABC-type bacteriocin/lantibiotic exporter with double-glycine peptidase domain